MREKLIIPLVANLHYVGFKYLPLDEDLEMIHFDQYMATLYLLPMVRLDANSDMNMRNLVAYEAYIVLGALIFIYYTNFMAGLIDNEEDVQLLQNSKIVSNYVESNVKDASLWNDIDKCIKLIKVKYLNQVISNINKHYNKK